MAEKKIPKKVKTFCSIRCFVKTIERVDKEGGAYSNLLLNEMMTKSEPKREKR